MSSGRSHWQILLLRGIWRPPRSTRCSRRHHLAIGRAGTAQSCFKISRARREGKSHYGDWSCEVKENSLHFERFHLTFWCVPVTGSEIKFPQLHTDKKKNNLAGILTYSIKTKKKSFACIYTLMWALVGPNMVKLGQILVVTGVEFSI